MDPYEAAWGRYLPSLAAATAQCEESFAFLHVAKTGGTSLGKALRADQRRLTVSLPFSFAPAVACNCPESPCLAHGLRPSMDGLGTPGFSPARVSIKVPHERYAALEWLREEMGVHGGRLDAGYLTCRPIRARLVSVFTDYWTQVDLAERFRRGEVALEVDEAQHAEAYRADAHHYREESGAIDGVAWFAAFAEHGSGFPFFLDDVFDGSVSRLTDDVSQGRLTLLPIGDVDDFIARTTGRPDPPRHRESSPTDDIHVTRALRAAGPQIERLAERDLPFDRAIALLTQHDEFAA